ncbi:MAG: DegT/DnrJ/EryC1/StrS family aminotransferase [bacterium]|nr:DegT/DnrJ/EryC1/StrS family aminotransferase [bacterium]
MNAVPVLKPVSTNNVPFVDLARQQAMVMPELRKAFERVAAKNSYILGEEVLAWEKSWADYTENKFAIGCSNGTDGVELMLLALGIKAGDEVITVSNTFFATVEGIVSVGATPILVDVLPETGLMDPTQVEKAITAKTKAIMPVHLYGHACDMDAILAICKKHNIPCLGDSAQAHGAKYKGQSVSSLPMASSYSFFPGKNLGALGDAGTIVTSDQALAEELSSIRDHGRKGKKYEHLKFGWNMRMDGMQAAFLSAKLKFLDQWTKDRQAVAAIYNNKLPGLPGLKIVQPTADSTSSYHLYVITVPDREKLKKELEARGIATGIHYPYGVHRQPAWATKFSKINLPVTEFLADHCLSLPIFGAMTTEEAERVVSELIEVLA